MKKTALAPMIILIMLASPMLAVTHIKTASAQSNTAPIVSIVYPTNESSFNLEFGDAPYFRIPLIYQTNTPLSWVGYSLDGRSNVTVTGNSTLVNGAWQSYPILTLYANDTSGNWATPQTVTFSIIMHPDTVQVEQTPKWIIAAFSQLFVIVVAGLLVYFKKRKE